MNSKKGEGQSFFYLCIPLFLSFHYSMDSFFMYIRPNLLEEGDKDIPAAILFTEVVPFYLILLFTAKK